MKTYLVTCYLCNHSVIAPLAKLTIHAGNEHSARFQAFQQGAQEIVSVALSV